jgi:hypothetical protein
MRHKINSTKEFFESVGYAFRALHREILSFRFDYPLDVVPEAGPKESLHYYLYSEKREAKQGGERPHKMKSPQTPFRTT